MLVKMKFVNIIGPKDDLDRAIETYVLPHEIQIEDAMSELKDTEGLTSADKTNQYIEPYKRIKALAELQEMKAEGADREISIEEALEIEERLGDEFKEIETEKEKLKERIDHFASWADQMRPYCKLDVPVEGLLKLEFVKFRFGKLPKDSYKIYDSYLKQKFDAVFLVGTTDSDYVWGAYFVSTETEDYLDALFSALHFERLFIPAEMRGTPQEVADSAEEKRKRFQHHLDALTDEQRKMLKDRNIDLQRAYQALHRAYMSYDVRKKAAIRKDDYYIILGWMTAEETKRLELETAADDQVTLVVENPGESIVSQQPVKLKNFKFIQPFELFIRMYSMPAHTEFDPTPFLALTYTILFGAMFGDFGQGAIVFLGSFILYKWKKIPLAGVGINLGASAMIFGLLYGSVFGFEDVIPALWMRPMDNIMTVMIISVGIGVGLLIVTMLMGIYNTFRAKDFVGALIGQNSIVGLIFYLCAIGILLFMLVGNGHLSASTIVIILVLPLIFRALNEPIHRVVEKKKPYIEGSKAMFGVETFFEMFEVVLTYATNTISFVRVGAFALSHAGMMQVVLMLAGKTSGVSSILILVLGNVLVMCLEGLIVGIQVLRLEYYEMFSHFYQGGSALFRPSIMADHIE